MSKPGRCQKLVNLALSVNGGRNWILQHFLFLNSTKSIHFYSTFTFAMISVSEPGHLTSICFRALSETGNSGNFYLKIAVEAVERCRELWLLLFLHSVRSWSPGEFLYLNSIKCLSLQHLGEWTVSGADHSGSFYPSSSAEYLVTLAPLPLLNIES